MLVFVAIYPSRANVIPTPGKRAYPHVWSAADFGVPGLWFASLIPRVWENVLRIRSVSKKTSFLIVDERNR